MFSVVVLEPGVTSRLVTSSVVGGASAVMPESSVGVSQGVEFSLS